MDETFSLKWDKHNRSFLQLLSVIREKNTYTDVTLACDGRLYNTHKLVLSACSEYFSYIFDNISCASPVIILKDMTAANLEVLLDYMYLGEVNVRASDLPYVIEAAESLKLKGLAVGGAEPSSKIANKKRSLNSSPSKRKMARMSVEGSPSCRMPSPEPINEHNVEMPQKHEDAPGTVVIIKQEDILCEEEFPIASELTPDNVNIGFSQPEMGNCGQPDNLQDPFNMNEMSSGFDNLPISPSTSKNVQDTINPVSSHTVRQYDCSCCSKTFSNMSDLKRHIRIHTGEMAFECQWCMYGSNVKHRLTSHILAEHQSRLHDQSIPSPAESLEELSVLLASDGLCQFLTWQKGASLMDSTRKVVRRLMSQSLACSFSLTGLGAKRMRTKNSFKDHIVARYVLDAIMTMHQDATHPDVYECIRKVLKGAPDWNGGVLRRKTAAKHCHIPPQVESHLDADSTDDETGLAMVGRSVFQSTTDQRL